WPRSRSVSAPSSVTKTSPCWKGLMVPGSTLRQGSSLRMVTLRPRDSSTAPREAEAMPFPNEETTPPVTKIKRVIWALARYVRRKIYRGKSGLSGGTIECRHLPQDGKPDYQKASGRSIENMANGQT